MSKAKAVAVVSMSLVSYSASQAFATAKHGPSAAGAGSLRGAATADRTTTAGGSKLPMEAVLASGALAAAAVGRGRKRRGRGVAVRAYESVHDFLLDVNRDRPGRQSRSPGSSRQATATVQEAAREQPAAKEAEKAVITTDSQGRYRFVVPGGEAPTTETTKAVITKDSQGRDRFVVPLLTTDSQGRDRFVAPAREAPAPQAVREAPAPQAVRTPELVMSMASSTPEVAMPMPSSPFNPAMAVGVTAPLGFFDPLGFSKVGDEAGFRKLRTAEIKHGRVAMMASVGAVIQHFLQLPGFESVPKGLGAVASAPGAYGFTALVLIAGALELFLWKEDESKEVGDYGNPLSLGVPLGWSDDMRNAELNNGRAAMFAAVGIIAAELNTGLDAVQQFN